MTTAEQPAVQKEQVRGPTNCQACHWWVRWAVQAQSHPGHGPYGECRKNSPHLMMRHGEDGVASPYTKWPSTKHSDFCGRWEARKEG